MLHLRPRSAALVGVATIGVWVLATAPARGQGPQPTIKAAPIFANGMAQVVPAFQDSAQWIRQELWVETNFDSDHDGKPDRVLYRVKFNQAQVWPGYAGPERDGIELEIYEHWLEKA